MYNTEVTSVAQTLSTFTLLVSTRYLLIFRYFHPLKCHFRNSLRCEIHCVQYLSSRLNFGGMVALQWLLTSSLFTGNWKFWFWWCFRIRCRWDSRWEWLGCLQFGMPFSDFKLVSNSVDIVLIGFCFRPTRLIQIVIRSRNLFVLLPRTIERERMLARKKMSQLCTYSFNF